ncbi:HupE/UreJ family protein [Ancylobacter sp. MQZ15Z-1]|uniref:HupE/UreJ family protein n=1 Tax=Ancylobacter mangrovi TaxID=2972472 RepID=A0A9X2T243_9HYPH|nr:HupE/UreJ family protein [Ancylobacter mangrovi]MCS0495502.1 HupE/UreJ family protein [Ancylobacter mangrovi]
MSNVVSPARRSVPGLARHAARAVLAGGFALVPALAFAHPGHGPAVGFAHGFLHPVSGLDHVLAMVAVGIFAAQLGGRAIWAVPASFVALMAAGGFLGMSGIGLPLVELGIALSIIVLGGTVALGRKDWPLGAAMALVGFFALFHGHAHGAEMPVDASGLEYAAGFMAATAALHAAGIGLALSIGKLSEARAPRLAQAVGAVVAVAGLGILSGAI